MTKMKDGCKGGQSCYDGVGNCFEKGVKMEDGEWKQLITNIFSAMNLQIKHVLLPSDTQQTDHFCFTHNLL